LLNHLNDLLPPSNSHSLHRRRHDPWLYSPGHWSPRHRFDQARDSTRANATRYRAAQPTVVMAPFVPVRSRRRSEWPRALEAVEPSTFRFVTSRRRMAQGESQGFQRSKRRLAAVTGSCCGIGHVGPMEELA